VGTHKTEPTAAGKEKENGGTVKAAWALLTLQQIEVSGNHL
jgi:hypothetical protein